MVNCFYFAAERIFPAAVGVYTKLPIPPFENRREAVVGMQRKQRSQAYQQLVQRTRKSYIFIFMKMNYPTEWPQFYTATILNWQHLLQEDKYKNIIVESLKFCVKEKKVKLYAFVIMSNHIHLVWQQLPPTTKVKLQHSLMTFTAQKIKEDLQKHNPTLLENFRVDAKDRMYQIWERNPLTVDLFSPKVFHQKIEYVHLNPVKAGLCLHPEDYYYSSANFYTTGIDEFNMLTHYDG